MKAKAVLGVKSLGVLQVAKVGVNLVSLAILARLLNPDDFGLVAMATVVTAFVMRFGDLGFASALVQRKNCSHKFLSSVFWLTLILGLLLVFIIVSTAPLVGEIYAQPNVTAVIQGLSLGLLIQAILTVPRSLLERELEFLKLAVMEFAALLGGAAIGIAMAFLGAGVWSLVVNAIAFQFVLCILVWRYTAWRPSWTFRWHEISSSLGYSLNQTGAMIVNFVGRNADTVLIGRFLGATDLAFYNMAYRLLIFPLENISAVLIRVLFPVMSRSQEDDSAICAIHLKYVSYVSLCTFPMMMLLGILAEPFVYVVFGPGWSPVVKILALFSVVGAIQSITHTGTIYRAKGRTDLMFVWATVTTIVYVLAFAVGLKWGISGVAIGYVVSAMVLTLPGLWLAFRLIGLSLTEFFLALVPSALASLAMGSIIYLLISSTVQSWSPIAQLVSMCIVGSLIYVTILIVARVEAFLELLELLLGPRAKQFLSVG